MQTFHMLPVLAAGLDETLYWLGVGSLAGALARWLLPGEQKMNWILTMILGIAGAFLGDFALAQFNKEAAPIWMSIASATGGAFLLLVLVQALGIFKKKA